MSSAIIRREKPIRSWRVWAISIAVWTFLTFYYAALSYKWRRDNGYPISFAKALVLPATEYSIAAFFTPFIYAFARKYPVDIANWRKRVPLHVAGIALYAFIHSVLRVSIYPPMGSGGKPLARTFSTIWRLFLSNTYDDGTGIYVPILVIAQMAEYYQKYRDRELRAAHLETELAQTQLRTLKTQLQPHFLFNTLHSISALMHLDVGAADRMMTRLSELLRLSMDTANVQECSLRRELEFLDTYLQIEQTRFSDRLTIDMQIDPETYDAKVPYMMMQPLAENAIRHGTSKLPSGGRIEVHARRENNRLRLSIADNGPGFDFPFPNGNGNVGLGLRNTQRRLEGLYGRNASFSVVRQSKGVAVNVVLPFEQFDEETQSTSGPSENWGKPNGNSGYRS